MEYRHSVKDIEDIYRYKALIRHDIKLLEIKLNHQLNEANERKSGVEKTLASLCIKYYVLLCLLKKYVLKDGGFQAIRLSDIDFPLLLNTHFQQSVSLTSTCQIGEEIKCLHLELLNANSCENEISTIEKIISCYLKLYYKDSIGSTETTLDIFDKEERHDILQSLCNQQLMPFINAIITQFSLEKKHYVTLSKEVKQLSSQFMPLTAASIDKLLAPFQTSEVIDFIQQLYAVSENPQLLLTHGSQTVRLLSIQSRATLLYQSIANYFHWVKQLAEKNNRLIKQVSMIGIEEMPSGVCIVVDSDKKSRIEMILKKINAVQVIEDDFIDNKLMNIENSFKYWFNPNRLVDAVLAIEQRIKIDFQLSMTYEKFQQYLEEVIQELSTARCINFYGNFSNKDVNYLMRTLKAVAQGYPFDWLPTISSSDKDLCLHVYRLIEIMMKSVCLVLNARGIKTEPFGYTKPKDFVKPGRRNKSCILHLLNIYSATATKDGSHLETLFDKLEAF